MTTTRWLSRSTSTRKVEEALASMTDGIDQVIAVEVYDHPEAKVAQRGDHKGQLLGPWLLGPPEAVHAELAESGYTEFTEVASVGMGRAEYDRERGQ